MGKPERVRERAQKNQLCSHAPGEHKILGVEIAEAGELQRFRFDRIPFPRVQRLSAVTM